MTYDVARAVFVGGAIASGVFLAIAVFLLIFFNVPNIIGDFTGANARKAIKAMREQNEGSGNKTYKSSAVNRERGKITTKISPSGSVPQTDEMGGAMRTEKIDTGTIIQSNYYPPAEETSLLAGELRTSDDETSVLSYGYDTYGNTTLLQGEYGVVYNVERDITFIHTDVMII